MPCLLCENSFEGAACPNCDPVLVENLRTLEAGCYPALALPPAQGINQALAHELRLALLKDDLAVADAAWLQIVRGMHGTAASDRDLQAVCWDAYGFFMEHQGRSDDARRAHQRATTARKDPSELKRKQDGVAEARLGHSAEAMKRLHADEYHQADPEVIKRVQEELDRQLDAQARRARVLKVGAFSIAGVAGGAFIGVSAVITGAVAAGIGFAWSTRT